MQPLDEYSAAYVSALALCLLAVRNSPDRTACLAIIFLEWGILQCWHGWTGEIAPAMPHTAVDLGAVAAFRYLVPKSRHAKIAGDCFTAMMWLHVLWALNLAYPFGFRRFDYLSIYAILGYLAMFAIAGGPIAEDIQRLADRFRRRAIIAGYRNSPPKE